jgi:hypothetical protein
MIGKILSVGVVMLRLLIVTERSKRIDVALRRGIAIAVR